MMVDLCGSFVSDCFFVCKITLGLCLWVLMISSCNLTGVLLYWCRLVLFELLIVYCLLFKLQVVCVIVTLYFKMVWFVVDQEIVLFILVGFVCTLFLLVWIYYCWFLLYCVLCVVIFTYMFVVCYVDCYALLVLICLFDTEVNSWCLVVCVQGEVLTFADCLSNMRMGWLVIGLY